MLIVIKNYCHAYFLKVGLREIISRNKYEKSLSPPLDFSGAIIKIVTLTGQIISETKIISGNQHAFDMNAYAPGFYFIEVNYNGEIKRMKLMKN